MTKNMDSPTAAEPNIPASPACFFSTLLKLGTSKTVLEVFGTLFLISTLQNSNIIVRKVLAHWFRVFLIYTPKQLMKCTKSSYSFILCFFLHTPKQ